MRERTAPPEQAPHLRADAERNRRRLLDAARAVFAEQGPDASIAEIRQRACVGQGTVFRHFPTKDLLLAAVARDAIDEMSSVGNALLSSGDPGGALREFMRVGTRMNAEDRCLSQVLCTVTSTDPEVAAAHERLMDIVGQLLARAQDAGAVRRDVTRVDVVLLTSAVSRATTGLRDVAPDLWRRYLDIVFDGLRPAAAHPLSHEPPTQAQLRVACYPDGGVASPPA